MYRLTRSELRIIEETKKQGAEAEKSDAGKRGARIWPIVVFALIFIALAAAIKLFIGLLS